MDGRWVDDGPLANASERLEASATRRAGSPIVRARGRSNSSTRTRLADSSSRFATNVILERDRFAWRFASGPNDEDAIDIGSPKVGKFETRRNGRADNRHRDAINVHTGTVRATRSGRDVELRPLRTKSFKIIALTDCETRSIGGLLGCGLARTQRRHFMQAWNNSKRNSYFSYFSSTGINVSS